MAHSGRQVLCLILILLQHCSSAVGDLDEMGKEKEEQRMLQSSFMSCWQSWRRILVCQIMPSPVKVNILVGFLFLV